MRGCRQRWHDWGIREMAKIGLGIRSGKEKDKLETIPHGCRK